LQNRKEWLLFCYDREYDPIRCYHIEIRWVVGSGCSIVEFVSSIKRKAKNLSLEMIDVPHFAYDEIVDGLPCLAYPWAVSTVVAADSSARDMVERYELQKLGFCLDVNASVISKASKKKTSMKRRRQYIHRSGSAFIRRTKTGFEWYPNTARTNRNHVKHQILLREIFEKFETKVKIYASVIDIINAVIVSAIPLVQ
jgi:hypothetical protein